MVKTAKLFRVGLVAVSLQACMSNGEGPTSAASPPSMQDEAAVAAVASQPELKTVSFADDGQARFMVAPRDAAMSTAMPAEMKGETAARLHMLRYREQLGLSSSAIASAVLEGEQLLPEGAALYRFVQRVNELPVFQARANIVLDRDKNLVSLANGLVPTDVTDAISGSFALPPEAALGLAYVAAGGPQFAVQAIADSGLLSGGWHTYSFPNAQAALGVLDASARPVMFRDNDQLVHAYHIELMTRLPNGTNHGEGFVIAGDDGRVLLRKSLTAFEAFSYRVWADPNAPTHIPLDGPLVDCTPHPTGVPDKLQLAFAPSYLIPMDSFNSKHDPWLDASATYTFGNNVQAYSDRNETGAGTNDGFQAGSDYRAETTSPKTFDRTYDLAQQPNASPDQIKASITSLFYVTNWLHDYYYDSGFNEAAGNAQKSNYGRGGVENDPLLAEAQDSADSGQDNNANMSTPADGRSPRMQMYVWTGPPNRKLETQPPIVLDDWLGSATFAPPTFDVPQTEMVLVDDGSSDVPVDWTGATVGNAMGTKTDACQAPTNVKGKIAVIDRGACTYQSKVQNAQMAGAVAALVINNVPGHTAPNVQQPTGLFQPTNTTLTIPMLVMSFEDGQKLKGLFAAGPVQATKFFRGVEIKHDGSIDTTVVTHEWGHYLHMRLQDGQGQQYLGMSEGWGDFNALFMVIRDGDDFPGRSYAMGTYAAGGFDSHTAYYGVRRAPYSVEYTMNPFTFQHIRAASQLPDSAPISIAGDAPMNEPHNVGEIWAEMMFEVYANILEVGRGAGRSFDDSKRRMAGYVVAALKAAPDDPSFVEQRDAVLSVIRSMAKGDPSRADDADAAARAFAKRGLGAKAVAPPKSSMSLNEAVESYIIDEDDTPPPRAGGAMTPPTKTVTSP